MDMYYARFNQTNKIEPEQQLKFKAACMKKLLLMILVISLANLAQGQTTYYWVGSAPSANGNINTGANWNTSLNGSGNSRPASAGPSDILIFDGTNLGGSTPVTGVQTVNIAGGITTGQMRFVNGANIRFIRPTSGTSTIIFDDEAGDDFYIEAGSTLSFTSTVGSIRMQMGTATTLRVAGTLVMNTTLQARFDNTTAGSPHQFIFESGSKFHTNITSGSSSYAFGSSSQSSEKWVLFEPGSEIFYEGGFSPIGNNSTFTAIDIMPGVIWHHRASNPTTGAGSFFSRRSFGDIIVENNATLTTDGPIFRIENLTVENGSSFVPHSSGQTVVLGNLTVNGNIASDPASTNRILFAGSTTQTVSGTGSINVGGIMVAEGTDVLLQNNITTNSSSIVFGKLNFQTNQLSGAGTFVARGDIPAVTASVNTTAGSFMVTGNNTITASDLGHGVSGPGIPANTSIVAFSVTTDTIYLSSAATATATAITINVGATAATLATANINGFNPASGSTALTGSLTFDDGVNYIINGATSWPFGVNTSGTTSPINSRFLEVNANTVINRSIAIDDHLTLNGKLSIPELNTVHIKSGAVINGAPGSSNYIATGFDIATGNQASLIVDGLNAATLIPIGTSAHYMPVTIIPAGSSDFAISVFEGITENGLLSGVAFTPLQKLTVIDAVWNIARTNGMGGATITLGWPNVIEGATFTTLPNSDIGIITNDGTAWSLPVGTADNTANSATATFTAFGRFSLGAVPQVDPFVFNPLPGKNYGDPDFNGGATSLNSTQPIVYTSSDPSVATIVSGNIHIVGAGTADITATQATDGIYPAASITQTLTVTPAPLTIQADDKTKFETLPNPTLTATYTGFVYGEDPADLLTPAVLATTAVTTSAPGTYPITVSGATSNNYTITFVDGTLTVQAKTAQEITFNALPVKTYGNANFPIGATSTNNTIPLVVTSSNTSVATIVGNNIHIVGAGTTEITASQAGNDGYFPATDVTRTLTVNKANLTIRVRDTTKVQGEVNPDFTITYTGFVLGENASNLLTPLIVHTDANVNSIPGVYPIVLSGATSNNYNVNLVHGNLRVFPAIMETVYLNAFVINNSTLGIRVFHPTPTLADIYLHDLNGRILAKKNVFLPEGVINSSLNISNIPAGVYILSLRGDGVNISRQIIIAK